MMEIFPRFSSSLEDRDLFSISEVVVAGYKVLRRCIGESPMQKGSVPVGPRRKWVVGLEYEDHSRFTMSNMTESTYSELYYVSPFIYIGDRETV